MSNNFLVAPGTILKEYMDARDISQKELSLKIENSEKYISNLINGKAKLSEEIALKLEGVFPDLNAKFWLDLENDYRLKLLRGKKNQTQEMKIISRDYQFDFVFKDLKYSLTQKADEMLRILGANDFNEVETNIKNLTYNFMEDGGNKKALYVWLKLCEYEMDIQNNMETLPPFAIDRLKNGMSILKNLILTTDFQLAIKNIRKFLNQFGVPFVVLEAVPTSKVRGATKFINDRPVIFLSTRYKRFDTFYFALIHELEHIFTNSEQMKNHVTYEEEELELLSNENARRFFVDIQAYENFKLKFLNDNEVSKEEIIIFAKEQKVIPDIIIGFLEHDEIITDMSKYYYLKSGIK